MQRRHAHRGDTVVLQVAERGRCAELVEASEFDVGSNESEGILETARVIQRKCTKARSVVLGLLPREKDENGNDCMTRIEKINQELSTKSKLNNYQYEYFGDGLLGNNHTIDKTIMPDGLHLNEEGYKLAGLLIQKIIKKYL